MDANSDPRELAKFEAIASRWWDPAGEMMALHRINPVRLDYVDDRASLAGKRCVDVGCGGGLLAEGLAARAAAVLGIDLATGPLTVARLHALESGLDNLSYRETSAGELAATEPDGFDVVTCMEVLEHVPDPGALVHDLGRLARPGGDVIMSTLNRGAKSFALAIVGAEYLLGLVPRGTHEYDRLIRPSELDAWARAAGLQLLDLAGLAFDPISRTARLSDDIGVNYLAHFRRPAGRA